MTRKRILINAYKLLLQLSMLPGSCFPPCPTTLCHFRFFYCLKKIIDIHIKFRYHKLKSCTFLLIKTKNNIVTFSFPSEWSLSVDYQKKNQESEITHRYLRFFGILETHNHLFGWRILWNYWIVSYCLNYF